MATSVLVVGLGRFGTAAALELMALGHEVLAIDRDPVAVDRIAPQVTHAMQLDASDEASLRSVGAADFAHAVVAMTQAREASIFATMALKTLGVGNVVAKAGSELHGAILLRVGADRVVYPEREMGQRVAHILRAPTAIDYLDVGPRFGIVKARPPETFVGRSVGELDLGRLDLTVVALRRGDRVIVLPQRDQALAAGDELILLGRDDRLDELGA